MDYIFQAMTQEQAEDIAASWRYQGEYSFYDMNADPEDLEEFLDPEKREGVYFVVLSQNELIGFYSFQQSDKDTVDIGLGMKPELTGKGNGAAFLAAGLEFAKIRYRPKNMTLSVAVFNERAIKLYKKLGFKETESFVQATNGGQYDFVKMTLTGGIAFFEEIT
ncbi:MULTISPECIES: GNAT family N-acetyltransferase [unclassified Planococcus (in: firmicutes)]|uniref:GNAT family N-acetyltransferase n=1 Tax=unclassified Planococcus (in: firmicutes) TaxID=2662419 RepID=UPI000C34E849|nr:MULTISPECIES: GNAT family protein [unclassified Planococcus (in: firmicutes)]AUD15001.1 GNAT family N-acetyltransferase [Planococcus sp. MB-3u-03]PKG47060.1 GNAT family N-acetyltransferase [Planococcus sp. Urea-trap-24]PKG87811.1 GNAT family N-acetyltransferase [Planococcus sp. Urea-3u-39]PKH35469.1 GNAT family N-acetyltransferase [Planococcus sp. MB-3u-09]